MSRLYSTSTPFRHQQSLAWRILFALLSGHTDDEVVRAIFGCHREEFEQQAVFALEFVYDKSNTELAKIIDPPTAAGAA
jgi:hypothetical protein